MRKRATTRVILGRMADFESRKKSVESLLTEVCHTSGLVDILGRNHAWAIVGGVVRDCLLVEDPRTRLFFNPWPDVDVAFAHPELDVDRLSSYVEPVRISIAQNSFGGWKISADGVGELDVWKVALNSAIADSSRRWLMYLQCVDFGINAVAFSWPECRIAIHPLWRSSCRQRRILRVCVDPVMRHLQPARAVALAVKLEKTTDWAFKLSDEVRDDLTWLIKDADCGLMREALVYLQRKISSGRWPRSVLERFLSEVASARSCPLFERLVTEIFGHNLEEYVSSAKSRHCSRRAPISGQRRLFPEA